MFHLRDLYAVLILAGVLVNATAGTNVRNEACDLSVQDVNNLTLNCSRRNIETISHWPDELNKADDKDGHVLITFFNNSITNITILDTIRASRIAISFKSNRINEIQDNAFRNVHNLVYLDLSNNRLSGDVLRSEIFQGQYNNGEHSSIALETLNLGYNRIHSLDRYLFHFTPNLTRLYLNNNPIEILDHVTVMALSSATKLEVLDLSKTDIDTIPLDTFRGLLNLRQIDLSGNKFLTVPESLSLVGSTLKYLTFNNNPIVELNDDSFIGLSNLLELEVGENDNLEEVKRSTFTPLKSLRVLHLCHNRNLRYISHNAFRLIKDKWTLKEVYLDENNLSELPTDLLQWNSCAAPMRLSGTYITNFTAPLCPSFDTTFAQKNRFSLKDLKPKHVLWSILGVATVVGIGMLCGILVNFIKELYKKNLRSEPIRYINIVNDSSYA
ncbi:leucine-rich transmembrane protein [Danaus plexippus plexippus]|uniref:Leucine-rich transmembrane protein n=1 Tax=Danaus plexippus plexippus TaxID=278856 RepID=A0A212FFF3_DANPL|nr:leucine-rich transmembrane protein [Danaus plexippus plexippus]